MRINYNQLIKFCGTRTVPAAETESIGLPANLPTGRQACQPFTDGNSLNRRAVMVNGNIHCTLGRFKTLTITEKAMSFTKTILCPLKELVTLTIFE
jgi:hypothetical protein